MEPLVRSTFTIYFVFYNYYITSSPFFTTKHMDGFCRDLGAFAASSKFVTSVTSAAQQIQIGNIQHESRDFFGETNLLSAPGVSKRSRTHTMPSTSTQRVAHHGQLFGYVWIYHLAPYNQSTTRLCVRRGLARCRFGEK